MLLLGSIFVDSFSFYYFLCLHHIAFSYFWMCSKMLEGFNIPFANHHENAANPLLLVKKQIRNVLDLMRRGEGLRFEVRFWHYKKAFVCF